jgi:hypothetical protein
LNPSRIKPLSSQPPMSQIVTAGRKLYAARFQRSRDYFHFSLDN